MQKTVQIEFSKKKKKKTGTECNLDKAKFLKHNIFITLTSTLKYVM